MQQNGGFTDAPLAVKHQGPLNHFIAPGAQHLMVDIVPAYEKPPLLVAQCRADDKVVGYLVHWFGAASHFTAGTGEHIRPIFQY